MAFEFDFTQINRSLGLDQKIDLASLLALRFALAIRASVKNCMLGNPKLFKDHTQVLQYKTLGAWDC